MSPRVAAEWHGNVDQDSADVIPPASDYERACKAPHPAAVLTIGDGTGVVIGAQEGVSSAWWQHRPSGGICLVGCVYGDEKSDERLQQTLEQDSAADDWQQLGTVAVKSSALLLFHAASEGASVTIDPSQPRAFIEDAVSVGVTPGIYRLRCRVLDIEGMGQYHLVCWQPTNGAA